MNCFELAGFDKQGDFGFDLLGLAFVWAVWMNPRRLHSAITYLFECQMVVV
jgi:hypothetical protein